MAIMIILVFGRIQREYLKNFYTPRAYNESGKYSEETDFDKLCMKTSRKSVFDIIELYASYKDESFEVEV